MKARTTFDAWFKEVNAAVIRLTGLSADDLPDYDYDSAFEDELTPRQTARLAIHAAEGF